MKNSCSMENMSRHRYTLSALVVVIITLIVLPLQVIAQDGQIVDSLDGDQISQFSDFSVQQALTRIPGVMVNRDGEISLRGVGYNSYYVMVDGQRLSASSGNTRGTDLSGLPVGLIKKISWQKVLTPDMDADGLAGVIKLNTYRPSLEKTVISGSLGGGFNPEYVSSTGATGRSWLRFSGPISENVGMTVDVNYQREKKARETLRMSYDAVDFGSGAEDVLQEFAPGFKQEGANRFGANLRFDYTPSETSAYYFQGLANLDQFESAFHQNIWDADEDWVDANTVDGGIYRYEMNATQRDITQFTFQAGGKNEFKSFNLDYKIGWSQSEFDHNENLFPFEDSGIEYAINNNDKQRPFVTPVEETPAPVDMRLEDMTYIIDNYRDQEVTARINAEIPIEIGSIKFGANAILKEQDANNRGAYSNYTYSFLGSLNLEGFETGNVENRSVFGSNYDLNRLISPDEALSFFQSSIPNMRLDSRAYYRDSEIYNYLADQNIYGGYGMATLNFEPLKLIIGGRVEYTDSDFEGRIATYNRFDQFQEARDTTGSASQTEFFPNAQLIYQVNEQFSVSAAYSKTISRPTYNYLAPFELQTPQDTSLFKGNPGLSPVTSSNIDLGIDYIFPNSGSISISGFYKTLSDIIEMTETSTQIERGDYPFYDDLIPDGENSIEGKLQTYQNSNNDATVYGVEVAVQKQLNFLPGVFQNFGTYATYTWSESSFENSRGDETSVPGQSPHVVNAALNYSEAKFFAQVAYQWTAELLYEIGQSPRNAPALSNSPVYLDNYQDGYEELSATIRYDINDNVQLWGNVYNIIGNENIEYAEEEQFYPTNIYQRNGTEFNIGVRLTF